ncbi:8-oxo-dGTP diphosphatase [Specibacter sp. NPDC078709]|uniref:8-oxo-dGTP diphosphatase n=1 Tax=Specibacter sp. NPDC078709 TaxID=3154364 RepID=UPI003440796A
MIAADVTLCFLLRDTSGIDGRAGEEVLLGLKKTGVGAGKVVGIGGHVEPGESIVAAICREVAEETSITIQALDLVPAGTVEFVFPAKPAWDMFTTVFLCRTFDGVPQESSEIAPQWYPVGELPHAQMWADAIHWLPAFLTGGRGHWHVVLNDDNETVASSVHTPSSGPIPEDRLGS